MSGWMIDWVEEEWVSGGMSEWMDKWMVWLMSGHAGKMFWQSFSYLNFGNKNEITFLWGDRYFRMWTLIELLRIEFCWIGEDWVGADWIEKNWVGKDCAINNLNGRDRIGRGWVGKERSGLVRNWFEEFMHISTKFVHRCVSWSNLKRVGRLKKILKF